MSSLHADPELAADVAVYRKAAVWALRFPEELFRKDYLVNALAGLDRGLERAAELAAARASWPSRKGRLVRAFVSRVDGSVQPYGLLIPESYAGRPVRLDVWLHGRGNTRTEVSFIAEHDSNEPLPAGQDFIQLDVFGRNNVAYRWAGETDVFEAIESVRRRYAIDPSRVVLRGFSMGGAGVWHLGLHYPDRWAAAESGAGFNETRRYAKLGDLPRWQDAGLHIYDAVDYARNAWNLPFVGYGGDQDPQLQASVNVREQLERERLSIPDLRILFLVGPETGHRFHPQSKQESERFILRALEHPGQAPDPVRFVTYTTRYNRAFQVTIEGLERHYERAEVEARRDCTVTTRNVSRLRLEACSEASLDGQRVKGGPQFERRGGRWSAAGPDHGLRKRHGLQGPIDDAFLDSFLCVRPTGPSSPATEYALRALDRFTSDWAKYLRGDLLIKEDSDVSAADIARHHLVLFGDPRSNRLISRVMPKLPVRWPTAAGETLALIYPNPLNPSRYVVLNSGHTFGEKEFQGTNALLFPRLGDWGILSLPGGETKDSGYFDERWRTR